MASTSPFDGSTLFSIWVLQSVPVFSIFLYQSLLVLYLTAASHPGFAGTFWVALFLFAILSLSLTGVEVRRHRRSTLLPIHYLRFQQTKLLFSVILWTGFCIRAAIVEREMMNFRDLSGLAAGDLFCQLPFLSALVYAYVVFNRTSRLTGGDLEANGENEPLLTSSVGVKNMP